MITLKFKANTSKIKTKEVIEYKDEIWKPTIIDGYFISNYGRVKTNKHYKTERILENHDDGNGYRIIGLRYTENGIHKRIHKRIHQLVALAFIENPNNYTEINHIDKNKSNNHVSNLEWCSRQHNMEHGHNKELIQYDKNNNIIAVFESIKIASKTLHIPLSTLKYAIKNNKEINNCTFRKR